MTDFVCRQRAGLVVASLFALLALWLQPNFKELNSPNPRVRIYLTRAIVDDHSLSIDGPVRRYGDLSDKSRRQGRLYCDKAPGLSLLAVPLYRGMRLFWPAAKISSEKLLAWTRAIFVVGLAALALLLLDLWLLRLKVALRPRFAALAALAAGSLLLPYSLEDFGHVPAAFFVLLCAFMSLAPGAAADDDKQAAAADHNARRRRWSASWFGAGLAAGMAVLTEYPTLFLVAPVLAIAWLLQARDWRQRGRNAALIALGGLGPAAVFMLYNQAAFGGPLTTGYAFIANPYFHHVHEQGFMGLSWPRLDAFAASFFGAQRGLFFAAPWTLPAMFAGPVLLWRRQRALAFSLVVSSLFYAIFVSSFRYWIGGWALGQRHLTPLMPLLALSLGVLLQYLAAGWRRWQRAAQVVVVSLIGISVVQISAACLTMPTFAEEFINPFYELSLRLWQLRMFPHSLGTWFGLSDGWGLVPAVIAALLLLVLALAAAAPAHFPELLDARQRLVAALLIAPWLGLMPLVAQGTAKSEHRFEWIVDTVWEPRDDLPKKLPDPVKTLPRLAHFAPLQPAMLRHLARHLAAQGDNARAGEFFGRALLLQRRPHKENEP